MLAVIGTAGRRDDADRLDRSLYDQMYRALVSLLHVRPFSNYDALVSGGAAWADHLAVRAFLEHRVSRLVLHLPAPFDTAAARFRDEGDGRTANRYHEAFGRTAAVRSLIELRDAIAGGAELHVHKGFKAGNVLVGQADALLAFTFGERPSISWAGDPGHKDRRAAGLKAGGTAKTWENSPAAVKVHLCLPFADGAAVVRQLLSEPVTA